MISGLPPHRRLDPAMERALRAAAALARSWEQDYVGVEHVFCGILNTEDEDDPGRCVLAGLDVDPVEVRAIVKSLAGHPAGREIPAVLPLTPRCVRVLNWADDIRCRRKAPLVDAGHVMESILTEGAGVAFYAVAYVIKSLPDPGAAAPSWLAEFRSALEEWFGEAWSFPVEALEEVMRAVPPALLPWDRRAGPQVIKIEGWWHGLTGSVYQGQEEVLVFIRSKRAVRWWERWWFRRFYDRHTAAWRTLKNGRCLPPGVLDRRWPATEDQMAGRLNRARFQGRPAVGRLRVMQDADVDFCLRLYALLEEKRHSWSGPLIPSFPA